MRKSLFLVSLMMFSLVLPAITPVASATQSTSPPITWGSITDLDTSNSVGKYASIDIATDDSIHIAYWDQTAKDAMYMHQSPNSTTWSKVTVDSSTQNMGWYTAIDTDRNNTAHFSYWDKTNLDLRYAHCTTTCSTSRVDGASSDVGEYSSIAVDDTDDVHISYYDNSNDDLKYAHHDASTSSWSLQTVDSGGNVGRMTSIDVDDDERPHRILRCPRIPEVRLPNHKLDDMEHLHAGQLR